MKILNVFLLVFSIIAVLGLLMEQSPDTSSLWGLVYAGMVIVQSVNILTKK